MAKTRFEHENLKVFKQHGFKPQGESGKTQVLGRCPFCSRDKHFYINVDTKAWDCKACGKEGGYQKFLKQQASWWFEQGMSFQKKKGLAVKRGLSTKTLKLHRIGFNPLTNAYIIPIFAEVGDNLSNLRIYKNGRLHNSAGSKASLYGLKSYSDPKTIWLVEGEWDAMTMHEILRKEKVEREAVIAVPGANTFKPDWVHIFKDKRVHVIFDNDYDKEDKNGTLRIGAGKLGMNKIHQMLEGIARKIDFVHWPEKYDDGFDLNDFYAKKKKGNSKRALLGLKALLYPEPPPIPKSEEEEEEEERAKLTGSGVQISELYSTFSKYLKLTTMEPIDVTFGTIIANRYKADPVWLLLTGPSGCAKSDIIMSISESPLIYPISTLTTKTLISGSPGVGGSDPSLIPKLNGKILAIKDLTELLEGYEKDCDVIFGQLRNAFDGQAQKPFGTGVYRVYKSKFGVIAGVTEAIEHYLRKHASLGTRFILYKMEMPSSIIGERTIVERAQGNSQDDIKEEMKGALAEVSERCLNHDFGQPSRLPPEIAHKIVLAGQWLSRMRGHVERDKYTRAQLYFPRREVPTRVVNQLTTMLMGITQLKRKKQADMEDYNTIKNIFVSSAPDRREKILRKIWYKDPDKVYTDDEIREMVKLPEATAKICADDLGVLGIFKKKQLSKFSYQWMIHPEIKELIVGANLYD